MTPAQPGKCQIIIQIKSHWAQVCTACLSPASRRREILKTFYTGAINIAVWYSICSNQDCKALQRAEGTCMYICIYIYTVCVCRYVHQMMWLITDNRAVKIIKDPIHPGNCLFSLLLSHKCFCYLMAKSHLPHKSLMPSILIYTQLTILCNVFVIVFYCYYLITYSAIFYFLFLHI